MLEPEWEKLENVKTYILPFPKPLGYYLNTLYLNKILKKIKPHIFHVHYATGCGTLGRLSGYKPSLLSVWGTDVMVTPHESKRMKNLVIKNLEYYDWVFSTSKIMTKSVLDLCPQIKDNISHIPIGVDTDIFLPTKKSNKNVITVGTVKVLDHIYGIDILIKSFSKVYNYYKTENSKIAKILRLKIVGGGPQLKDLKALAKKMNIYEITEFIGQVSNHEVPHYLNNMDIYVAMSRVESFGVAVVEASACSLPVVVSNVGGLPEVVIDGETGFIVETENIDDCAKKLIHLINDESVIKRMGTAGRNFVKKQYEWELCFKQLDSVYGRIMHK